MPLNTALYINMTNPKLIQDFKHLRDHCIKLVHAYYTYTSLFNEENHDLLNVVAPAFFSDISEIMQRDWILQACKLMDPAITVRKLENLSIKLVNNQLEVEGLLSPSIISLADVLLKYGEKIKPARDKRIVHFDREYQVNGLLLGATTERELDQFLQNLQKYCDEIGIAIGVGALGFGCGCCEGDVIDLLKVLRESQNT